MHLHLDITHVIEEGLDGKSANNDAKWEEWTRIKF